jgi:hypothetical protein
MKIIKMLYLLELAELQVTYNKLLLEVTLEQIKLHYLID